VSSLPDNIDVDSVADFGREWARFDQRYLDPREIGAMFAAYFAIFPWEALSVGAVGFDAGCGSGRWAALVAPRVGHLHCVDASAAALTVARDHLRLLANCSFHDCPLDRMPIADASMDFGYCLGVLHHLPDPAAGLRACVAKLKPGAPFLVYIYYALDNRPWWFRMAWHVTDRARRLISHLPFRLKSAVTEPIAVLVYWPLARLAWLLERTGRDVEKLPLSAYRGRSLYTMRTDALDRFGTRLEHRFTAHEIEAMMMAAGLADIRFSTQPPWWCAVGWKRRMAA
jgi:SAM-dependent methyltransferase